jgi:L-threonylcarbamoyladenylate synthase
MQTKGDTPKAHMETIRYIIEADTGPTFWEEALQEGARRLRAGELVAFPTETVYGLGANAWDAEACARIFLVKGRPADNPLIVHVASVEQARDGVAHWPELAELCAGRFWPGPLTLVLPRNPEIPDVVTGGGDTVAVRVPEHPVARALIARAQCPVAAPSANVSGRPSPTQADHVWEDLGGRIPVIIDAGPCAVGVESTVLDLSAGRPVLLRPGGVPWEDLRDLLGEIELGEGAGGPERNLGEETAAGALPRSPGMKYRHYAPRAPIQILSGTIEERVEEIVSAVRVKKAPLALLCCAGTAALLEPQVLRAVEFVKVFPDDDGVREGAAGLFAAMRACDKENIALILAEESERAQMGMAYMNRLEKAGME